MGVMLSQRDRFLEYVQRNPVNCALLEQAAGLDVPDWWLTAGAVFQTVWNVIDGRAPVLPRRSLASEGPAPGLFPCLSCGPTSTRCFRPHVDRGTDSCGSFSSKGPAGPGARPGPRATRVVAGIAAGADRVES